MDAQLSLAVERCSVQQLPCFALIRPRRDGFAISSRFVYLSPAEDS